MKNYKTLRKTTNALAKLQITKHYAKQLMHWPNEKLQNTTQNN